MRNFYRRVVQWGFERLYHELAWSYDIVAAAVSWGYWPQWILAVRPWLQGRRVLELGCGTGHLQVALARDAVPHVGYDASPPMLRQARRRLRRHGLTPRLLQGYAQALPFASRSFSDVVATFPAPYIIHPATLREVRRVLRPDGQLMIVDGGQLHSAGVYDTVVGLAYRATLQSDGDNRYAAPLEQAGFVVEWRQASVGPTSVTIIIARPRETS